MDETDDEYGNETGSEDDDKNAKAKQQAKVTKQTGQKTTASRSKKFVKPVKRVRKVQVRAPRKSVTKRVPKATSVAPKPAVKKL